MKKILLLLLLFAPKLASASTPPSDPSDPWGINDFSKTNIALGSKPLRETIGGVVNIALGFLGILTTLLILWGGFKWMTSAGNSEQVDQAKRIISAGVIGLIIVLSAYAISRYVLIELRKETVEGV
ncbi:pilin [Patescibacteria group bacterium]|nr:pilin [Patescibacteria group bacterium]